MKKRGQANIITVILLVLLVLVAVIIVWNVVQPLIRKTGERVGTEAFTVSLSVEEAKLWVTGGAQVRVKRGAGEGDITALKFVFEKTNGETIVIERKEGYEMPTELETKIYNFDASEINEKIEKVSVVPMFEAGAGIEAKEENPEKNAVKENSGLVSWWKFDGDARDSVGENDGSLIDANHSNSDGDSPPDIINNELVLDGVDDYVDCGNDSSLDITNEITIGAWIKLNEITGYSDQDMILNKEGIPYEIAVHDNIACPTPNISCGCPTDQIPAYNFVWYLGAVTGFPNHNCGWKDGGGPIQKNVWTYLVLTYNGSKATTYVDGILQREYSGNGTIQTTSNALRIGARGAPNPPTQTNQGAFFNGTIDSVMLFNKALSEEQIKAIYNNQMK